MRHLAGVGDSYDGVAGSSAALVISAYSTSFGTASRLLGSSVRPHVRNVYALVRIADEIVDDPDTRVSVQEREQLLDRLWEDTLYAIQHGRSSNLVVHAFATTARKVGITRDLVDPFFDSMRADLHVTRHDAVSLERYIYGSAEVIGLMCLRAFLHDTPDPAAYERLAPGARRLGAAFQKVNFLRDLAEDQEVLGRIYFPGVHLDTFTDAERDRLLDDIDQDLEAAAAVIAQLPPSSRRAVLAAHALFVELARRLRGTPAAAICRERVRVPGPVKAQVLIRTLLAARDQGRLRGSRRTPHGPGHRAGHGPGHRAGGRSVVVVGGGIAGLATAALLARDGWSVDLLEQHEELGGRVGSWECDGFRFDTGPSWYLMPEVFEHFFELFGRDAAEELGLSLLDPAYRVFYEGHAGPVDIHADRDTNVATFERIEPGAGAALEQYLASAEDAYAVALRRFLYSTFETLTGQLRWDVVLRTPRLARLLTQSLESFVARRFTDPRLTQILGYPAVFLGTSPDRAPSLYHLMSRLDLADGVRYPRGGFGQLLQVFAGVARDAGARLRTGATVTAITTTPSADRRGTPAVTGVRYRDAAGIEQELAADVVVGAADLHHLETELLPRELQTYPQAYWDDRDPGPGAVLACLGVDGSLPELPHHSLFFTADWRTNFDDIFGPEPRVPDPASVYVCKPSQTDPTVAPEGAENLFVLVPVPADVAIGSGGLDGCGDALVEKAADAAIDQIAAWARIPDLHSRIRVRRTFGPGDFARDLNAWSGGALGPGHTLRQSAFFRTGNISRKVSGLYYAGASTVPGIGLPMCLISAELVVKRLRGDRSSAPLDASA